MEVKAAIFLQGKSAADFAYTNKGIISDTTTIEGVSDGDKFLRTLSSLELIGINVGQQREMHKVLSGILHLGQVLNCSSCPFHPFVHPFVRSLFRSFNCSFLRLFFLILIRILPRPLY